MLSCRSSLTANSWIILLPALTAANFNLISANRIASISAVFWKPTPCRIVILSCTSTDEWLVCNRNLFVKRKILSYAIFAYSCGFGPAPMPFGQSLGLLHYLNILISTHRGEGLLLWPSGLRLVSRSMNCRRAGYHVTPLQCDLLYCCYSVFTQYLIIINILWFDPIFTFFWTEKNKIKNKSLFN